MAVTIGEAAVVIRADASGTAEEIQNEVGPAAERAGQDAGDKLGDKMKMGIAGAGLAVGAGFAASLEQAALGDKLAAQLGASGDYAADLGQVAGDVYAGGFGEGLGEVNDALRSVIQSGVVMEDASNAQLQAVTESALNLASTFEVDVGGAANAAGRLVEQGLAANATEAFDIITRGFQQGANKGDDFLDTLNEYGTTFSQLGLTGTEVTGLLNQGISAGVMNTDLAADALREMGIRGREGAEGTADALKSVGLNASDYFAAMQAGGPAAAGALDQALDALRNTEDPAIRAAAATAIVGTQYEDLGDALLQLDPSEAAASLGTVEGAAAAMGDTLNDNASANLTSFYRTAQQAFVDVIGGQVIPIVESVVGWLRDNLGPTLQTVGGFITDEVVPPLQSLATWLGDNEPLVDALAATIGTVLVAALGVWGTRSVIEAAKATASWFATAAGSTVSAETQSRSALQVVTGWILMGAQALIQGVKIAAVWTAQVVASAVTGAASFAAQVARVVAGWVLMGAQALIQGTAQAAVWTAQVVASAVTGAVSFGIQVARVVAGWVLMGAQALLQAARMAAAWFIALGPVGWIIAVVIGLVALIIANWDKVKTFTVNAFRAIVDFVVGAWRGLVSAVGGFIGSVVSVVSGIPGKILGALSGLGRLLVGVGGDLIRGLVNGISAAAGFVGDVGRNIVNAIIGFVNKQVIGRINGLLEFTIAGVTINPPDIPRIPKLHSGGVFSASGGEGLAILADQERVATPQQRIIADRLLADLLSGDLPAPPAGAAGGAGVAVTNNVYASEGMSAAEVGAVVSRDTVWALGMAATRRVPVLTGAAP